MPGADHGVALELALDELMLEDCSACARVWTPCERSTVLGVSSRAGEELHLDACRADGVRVFRRISGGAAVYLAPGVVCFSVFMPFESWPESRSIRGAYGAAASLLAQALAGIGGLRFEPPADIAVRGRKLVGLAQARRRRGALVHGALLVSLDAAEVARYISHPPEEPAYRAGRRHEEFMTTLRRETGLGDVGLAAQALREALRERFEVAGAWPTGETLARAQKLAAEKYLSEAWTFRR